MHEREEDWGSVLREVTVFCSTFNTAVLDPTDQRFKVEAGRDWLFSSDTKASAKGKDIVVINLQEVVDLNNPYNLSYVGDITTNQRVYTWEVALLDILNSDDTCTQYKMVASESLVGLAQFVYVTEALFEQVYDVRTTRLGCGFLGVSGNKGAIGISFTLYDAPLVFMNCHLAAGEGKENNEKRQQDLRAILGEARFEKNPLTDTAGSSVTTSDSIWTSIATEIKGSVPTQESIPVVGRISPMSLPELPTSNRSPSNSIRKHHEDSAAAAAAGAIAPEAVSPMADPLRMQSTSDTVDDEASPSSPSEGHDSTEGDNSTEVAEVEGFDAPTRAALEGATETVKALPLAERGWRSGVKAAAQGSREVLSGLHEVVILAGDLNSRLDLSAASESSGAGAGAGAVGPVGHYDVLSMIDGGRLEALAPLDEVTQMLGKRTTLLSECGFEEGAFYRFPPTYKYQNKGRAPPNVLTQVTNLVSSTWTLGLEVLGVPPATATSAFTTATTTVSSSTGSNDSGLAEEKKTGGEEESEEEDDYQRPSDWHEYLAGKESSSPRSSSGGGDLPAVVAATVVESSQPQHVDVAGEEVATGAEKEKKSATKGVRVPGWCDRILHCTPRAQLARTRPSTHSSNTIRGTSDELDSPILPARVELHKYSRAELRGSDHRPVVCTYSFHLKAVDEEKENEILAHFEMECIAIEAKEARILQKSLNTSAVLSPQATGKQSPE